MFHDIVYYKMRKIEAGGNSMDERQRATLIRNMTDNLPTLRKLNAMEIYTDELNGIIKHREQDGGQNHD